jgi:hypothetical protein
LLTLLLFSTHNQRIDSEGNPDSTHLIWWLLWFYIKPNKKVPILPILESFLQSSEKIIFWSPFAFSSSFPQEFAFQLTNEKQILKTHFIHLCNANKV